MFYPTGKSTSNRCLICMDDESKEIEEALCNCESHQMLEGLKKWLDEKCYCAETWQVKEYMTKKGMGSEKIDEEMSASVSAPSAPAGAPAGNAFATLNTTPGMGIVATPQNGGTNTGFYNDTKDGSGDKFPSLTVGTPAAKKKKKGQTISSYLDFIKKVGKK